MNSILTLVFLYCFSSVAYSITDRPNIEIWVINDEGKDWELCRGSFVVNNKWVLTAGHCMKSAASEKGSIIFVGANGFNKYVVKTAFFLNNSDFFTSAVEAAYKYDLALIEVVKINNEWPASLPRPPDNFFRETILEPARYTDFFNFLKLPVKTLFSKKKFSENYKDVVERFEGMSLILSKSTSGNFQPGDSGAPLVDANQRLMGVIHGKYGFHFRANTQISAFSVPFGLCLLSSNIFITNKISISLEQRQGLQWLKAYSSDCPKSVLKSQEVFQKMDYSIESQRAVINRYR